MPVIEVATRKGLFTLAHSAGRWAIRDAAFLGDNVTLSMTDPRDGARYAALDHGHFGVKVHRKRQGGAWEEVAAPAYPEKPEGLTDTDGWGKPIPWATQRIWGLEPGGADQPGLIWCATIPGGLFRSLDHGASWQLVRSFWDHPGRQRWFGGGADLPGLHAICVDPRDSRVVRIGVSCGGVWVTRDGGETWENRGQGLRAEFMPPEQQGDPGIQDVHYMAQCRAAPERMWIQHHNGIFRSDDSGENWTEIHDVNPSTFGFGVVAHPDDPGRAWFVPGIKDEKRYPSGGALVVTRTRDGGKSFETLTNGLPQEHAYDVVLRHALAIDQSGERLAFGSTTGGVWASDDQGDHWQMVSHTLPPVYAVRFAEG